MKKTFKIEVTKKEFKNIRKGKQSIIILNNKENPKIKSNDKIIIKRKIGKIKRKVNKVAICYNLEELMNNIKKEQLGYTKKQSFNYEDLIKDYSNDDIKIGIKVIELKKKKHILKNIILCIILCFCFYLINIKIKDLNVKKYNNIINETSKERIDYVFIEINPSFVFTINNNRIKEVACLNDDCLSIYNDIDINDKNINEGIEIIYNKSKEKGFNTSNGIKIKSTQTLNIETRDYITIEYINDEEEKELLSKIKNNETIKNVNNDEYYFKLWEKLKKDPDYGKIYECKMNNNKLSCYFKKEKFIYSDNYTLSDLVKVRSNFISIVSNTFDKFGVPYETVSLKNIVYEIKVSIKFKESNLTFRCDIDGECSANLVKNDGLYHNFNGGEGGEIYYLYLYENFASLDLLNPNDIVNNLMIEIEDEIDYDMVSELNFLNPTKYPLIITDDSYQIGLADRQLCNLNNGQCNNYKYLKYLWKKATNDGIAGYERNIEGETIDKETYEKYKTYLQNYEIYAESLDEINLTGYVVEVELNDGNKYYHCEEVEINSNTCFELSKESYTKIMNLITTCSKRNVDYVIKRDVVCYSERCNINKDTFEKTDCIDDWSINE